MTAALPERDRNAGIDRNAGLDLLRASAALMVAVFHLRLLLAFDFGPLNPVVEGGDAGIYVFFALSGYLLYRPFLRGPVDLRSYALKRAGRILPGYFVALIALTLLTGNPLPTAHLLPYLTMTASYDPPLRAFLGNAWTLSAELVFYVLLPFVAALVAGRELIRLAAIWIAGVGLAMSFWILLHDPNHWLAGAFPFVAYAFVPGMLLAAVEQRYPRVFQSLARTPALIVGIGLILLETKTRGFPVALPAGLGTPLVMGWLVQHRLGCGRTLAFLGGASYAMYLWHKDLYPVYGPAGFLIAAVGAALSWAIVERPILDWAHRTARGWRRRAQEPALAPSP